MSKSSDMPFKTDTHRYCWCGHRRILAMSRILCARIIACQIPLFARVARQHVDWLIMGYETVFDWMKIKTLMVWIGLSEHKNKWWDQSRKIYRNGARPIGEHGCQETGWKTPWARSKGSFATKRTYWTRNPRSRVSIGWLGIFRCIAIVNANEEWFEAL